MRRRQNLRDELEAMNADVAAADAAPRAKHRTQREAVKIKRERRDEERRVGRAAKRRRNLTGEEIEVVELSD